MKNIGVSDSAWEYLSLIKIKNGFKSLEDVVDYIIKDKKEEKEDGIRKEIY